MIKKNTQIASIIMLLIHCITIQGMFTALRQRGFTTYRSSNDLTKINPLGQRRYWQPTQLKKTPSSIVAETAYPNKNFLLKGAALSHSSYWLKNVVSDNISLNKVSITDPMATFTNTLFQISSDGHISVKTESNELFNALTPDFFGRLRGAQEKNILDNNSVIEEIVNLGKQNYAKITNDVTTFPEAKIRDFIVAMNNAHKKDSDMAQSLEDAYLFLRGTLSNNHDLMHYLIGFNRYSDILSNQRLEEFKNSITKGGLSAQESPSDYNATDFEQFKNALLKIKMPSDQIKYARDHFALAVAAIIDAKRNMELYSPKVIMREGSYNQQPAFSTCAETAILDLLGNICFDEITGIFDPVHFFPTLKINSDLIAFFERYKHINTINRDKNIQNDFLKLVSGIKGVTYVNNNYEISSIANEKNLITLCNHFFSIQAKNLDELGKMLSNERRTFTFELVSLRDAIKEIVIKIYDKKTNKRKQMSLYFQPGHSWFQTGDRNAHKVFLDAKTLLAQHSDPMNMLFLYMHPEPLIDHLFFRKITRNQSGQVNPFSSSFFHAYPTENDYEKSQVIRAILLYSKDQKTLDYAYRLFKSLSPYNQSLLKDDISKIGTKEQIDTLHFLENRALTLIE